jgi:hypothetical protein
MFDEMERLRDVPGLFALLSHYATLGLADRLIWQDRLAATDDTDPRVLVRLHGELLAYGWIEQNTGATPILRLGVATACYRITAAGVRVLKQVEAGEISAA